MKQSLALVFKQNGTPSEVLKFSKISVNSQHPVLLKALYAPINPSDINQIEGKYPLQKTFDSEDSEGNKVAVGGNEGLFTVLSSQNNDYQPGDLVVPVKTSFGTWQTFVNAPADSILKVLPAEKVHLLKKQKDQKTFKDIQKGLAMMMVNLCTAYRLLKDFGLQPGQAVIQNAANSGVGRAVIQLAPHFKVKTVNVIRKRDEEQENEQLKQELKQLGAHVVLTDEELTHHQTKTDLKNNYHIQLALNCVGGDNALDLARHLLPNSKHVTYGAMSKKPFAIPATMLIFQNISFCGYWMAHWKEETLKSGNLKAYQEMISELTDLIVDEKVSSPPVEEIPFVDLESRPEMVKEILLSAQLSSKTKKKLFQMYEL